VRLVALAGRIGCYIKSLVCHLLAPRFELDLRLLKKGWGDISAGVVSESGRCPRNTPA
jgi:hypothetical protein